MNWYHYTVPYDNKIIIHAYVKMYSAREALDRLRRDDRLWNIPDVEFQGIVSEDVVKKYVNWDSRLSTRSFTTGFMTMCKNK